MGMFIVHRCHHTHWLPPLACVVVHTGCRWHGAVSAGARPRRQRHPRLPRSRNDGERQEGEGYPPWHTGAACSPGGTLDEGPTTSLYKITCLVFSTHFNMGMGAGLRVRVLPLPTALHAQKEIQGVLIKISKIQILFFCVRTRHHCGL